MLKYEINGQMVEFSREPSEQDIDEVAAQLSSSKVQQAEPMKGEPIKEGLAAGLSKSAVRGMMKGGLGLLQTAENAQRMVTGKESKFQGIIDQSQSGIDELLPREEVSGSIGGRVVENLAGIPALATQIEGLGGGLGGFAAHGALQSPEISKAPVGAAKGLLQGVLFNGIASMPLLPRIALGSMAFGIPSHLSNEDVQQQAADAITGGLLMGIAPGALENTKPGDPSPIAKGRTILVDSLKQYDYMRPIIEKVPTYGKEIVAEAISAATSRDIPKPLALAAIEKPEYLSNEYVKAEKVAAERLIKSQLDPISNDTNNKVLFTDSAKKAVHDLNLFIESNEPSGKAGMNDSLFSQIIAQTGGKFSPEFSEKLGLTKGELSAAQKRISKLEETNVLASMTSAEKAKILEWYDDIMNESSVSFNKARAMIAQMDHTAAMQTRYKQLLKEGTPPPSTQFVRIASQLRGILSSEIKTQYPKAGEAIERYANYKKAESVNKAFKPIVPKHIFKLFVARTLFRMAGMPLAPLAEGAILGAMSPRAWGGTIRASRDIGRAIDKGFNPNIKIRR